ncbi:hypothetical protein N7470_009161 [Penicillium chermesinum]|nr:hypothetical protein N7470_009161 [Penicillium chermesinum]
MPLYDVEYVCPLSLSQQEELAQAFTQLHSQRFQTPRVFINVRFTDASSQVVFRGLYIEHCRAIVAAWERIVGTGNEVGLRTVWVMGALTTALEAGIARPKTGEEKEWLRVNWPQFKALAEAGDEDFIDLMKEEELLA